MADERDEHDGDRRAEEPEDEASSSAPEESEERSSGRGSDESTWRGLLQGLKTVVSSSEDRISSALQDAIPREMAKEVVGYIKRQVDSARDESVRVVGKQIKGFLDNLDVGGELKKALTSLSFEIRTEVRFIPNDKAGRGVRPDAKVRVKVKPAKDDDGDESLAKALFRRTVDRALRGFKQDEDEDEASEDAPEAKGD